MENQTNYLNSLQEDINAYEDMIQYAKENHVPIMDKLSMKFINQLVTIAKPKRILEIGTAIGYSAINMAENSNAEIITIERDLKMIGEAKSNIAKYNLDNRIEIVEGDAITVLENHQIEGQFDLILIDAAKGKYSSFFTYTKELLNINGLILSDNVLFRGFVADQASATSKRLQKLAKKIDNYNKWLSSLEGYETSIVPIGDGIAITTVKYY